MSASANAENVVELTKVCPKCGEPKPLDQFYKDERKRAGIRSHCRTCLRAHYAKYAAANPEKMKAQFERQRRRRAGEFIPRETRQLPDGRWPCTKCGEAKPEADYGRSKGRRLAQCRICVANNWKVWGEKNPDKIAASKVRMLAKMKREHHQKKYGIPQEQVTEMARRQGNACAICRTQMIKKREPQVDHDHTTGAIRELLCQRCNLTVGSFEDNPWLFEAAAAYLRRHGKG